MQFALVEACQWKESGAHLSWDSLYQEWVWGAREGKVTILPWPGLVFGEHKGEFLQEGGKEDKELHPSQLFPQADTATCRRESRKVSVKEDIKLQWNRGRRNRSLLLLCLRLPAGSSSQIYLLRKAGRPLASQTACLHPGSAQGRTRLASPRMPHPSARKTS